ncbi:hypothetical protein SMALB_3382 [Streptomyces malaysiensis]|uniref:Uncharacterized protein n=1 Tax=Streptomyces malaysiensis TaxID=92644 RepID=A0A7X5X2K0_STRMQ|nr:hypothetical protein [Streptomyces malaysiensis]
MPHGGCVQLVQKNWPYLNESTAAAWKYRLAIVGILRSGCLAWGTAPRGRHGCSGRGALASNRGFVKREDVWPSDGRFGATGGLPGVGHERREELMIPPGGNADKLLPSGRDIAKSAPGEACCAVMRACEGDGCDLSDRPPVGRYGREVQYA